MIDKIISGGQTGADQAALDVAVKYNIPHGGWIPRGRRTESGPLPSRYRLAVMPTTDYRDRTRQNILDSQGTVILFRRHLTGGSKLTRELAKNEAKPYLAVDLLINDPFETAMILQSFVGENNIRVLNVAGPRASHDPGIYADVKMILETLVYLEFLSQEKTSPLDLSLCSDPAFPDAVDAAVDLLMPDLSLKAKTKIARLNPADIKILYFSWLDHLRFRLGLDAGNRSLVKACRQQTKLSYFTIEDAVMTVIKALKCACEQACLLRIVK
ncbi:MAG: putative molybdenum carrier protein [Desulfotignum sp.]|nr:putative molybdenum carrier protein [Desulfotignum sp.]MCF8125421.1 putative molybdenum carrier protein [Desulfotignum sp.]